MDSKFIKKYSSYLIVVLGLLLFVFAFLFMVKEPFETYNNSKDGVKSSERELAQKAKEEKNASLQEAEELEQLKKLKEIYKDESNASSDSMAVYGTMFDEIINYSKQNGLMIRSIEYNTNPTYDSIYASYSEVYNVCEFKFYFVGTYNQFKAFLADIVKYKYYISISKLNVTAFPENPDYLLINVSFTLYSEKNNSQKSKFQTKRRSRAARKLPAGT